MDNLELQHHGVKGMRWGIRKKRYSGSDNERAYKEKANKGKGLVKKYLAISGAVAIATLIGVYSYAGGRANMQNEVTAARKAAAAKGAATRAANKAVKVAQAAKSTVSASSTGDLVNASLTKIGKLHMPDIMR